MNLKRDTVTKIFYDVNFADFFDDLVKEIERLNYRVTRIYDIDNMNDRMELISSNQLGFKHYKVIEFCNLIRCSEMISADLLSSVLFPVKFLVYQTVDQQQVNVAYLKPTAMAKLFSSAVITKSAAIMEQDMIAVLEEVDF